jgi:hypothetical protein
MSSSSRKRARSIATLGVAAALVVGGVALAQGGSTGKFHHGKPPAGKRMPPPPIAGPMARSLTYAQFHVQRNGQAKVLRLDRGKIASLDSGSITLAENDGSEVTIATDEDTKVLAGPARKIAVTDLETGQEVLVAGPEGDAAKAIMLPPKRRRHGLRGHRRHGQMPPLPPGAFGGPPGGGSR